MWLTGDFSRVAASFARLQTMLKGLDPDVDRVGIISAWNPNGETASDEDNRAATADLLRDLRGRGLGAIRIGGNFFYQLEGSWLIPNASRDLMLDLCREYAQWSIIYGKKYQDVDEGTGFVFSMLGPDGQQKASKEVVVLTSAHQEPGHEPIDKLKTGFSFFKGDRPKKSKIPGQTPPSRKRFNIPFRLLPDKEEPTEE